MGNLSKINALAARQHGAFNRAQLVLAAFDRSAVHYRLQTGEWVRVDDSVCVLASAAKTREQALMVALLSRPGSVLTHRTACELYGIGDLPKARPVILVPRASNVRSAVADVFETDQFDEITTTTVQGFAVTTVPETLLLIARDIRGDVLSDLFDEALISGKLDLSAMASTLDREAGRRTPGTPQLRRLTSSRRPTAPSKSSSHLERLLERILVDPRVPLWTREYEFDLGGWEARVDFLIPSCRLILEADGRNWHARWRDMERDRRRDNALAARGLQVMRYTYAMLFKEPQRCLDEVVEVCRVRAA